MDGYISFAHDPEALRDLVKPPKQFTMCYVFVHMGSLLKKAHHFVIAPKVVYGSPNVKIS